MGEGLLEGSWGVWRLHPQIPLFLAWAKAVEQPLLGSHIEAEETHTLPPTEGPPDLGNHATLSVHGT